MNLKNVYVPDFLNTTEKWNDCVYNTNTVKKYEQLVLKILDDNQVTALGFYLILETLSRDLQLFHKDNKFLGILNVLQELIMYDHYKSKENK